ncbi:MAG: hypothetical protein ABL951_05600 [Alphaproteobacteria bacterium]
METDEYGDADGEAEAEAALEKIKTGLRGFAVELGALADEQVAQKSEIEKRWLDNLKEYHGVYDETIKTVLAQSERSGLLVNITRPKTISWESRLSDMLFPTDDENWDIQPTPVPTLVGSTALTPVGESLPVIQDAAKRAAAMKMLIDDQLRECNYKVTARQVIHDACKMGTGIMKGPVLTGRKRHSWAEAVETGEDGRETKSWGLKASDDPAPQFVRVDPWSFFPDMSARRPEDCEFWFERHLMNRKQLREFSNMAGVLQDEVRELIRSEPVEPLPDYYTNLRQITNGQGATTEDRYVVWEYRGPIERQKMLDICICHDDEGMRDIIEDDPMDIIQGVLWFCQGRILNFGIHVLDGGESLYSVYNFEKDETCMFGHGVPDLVRNAQSAISSAWRMILDNAALSVGPQVVVNRDSINPADGLWDIRPHKVWNRTSNILDNSPAFETYNIPSGQAELANIVRMAQEFADDETQLPMVAQGEPGSRTAGGPAANTVGGLSMLMNSVNVVFRRAVKNFDDDMTTPSIRRMYDWNMQFSKDETVKGDYNIDARGSSVLLVREVQSQNLMALALQFGSHPIFGPMTKHADLYRKLVQANMIKADEVVKTDDEIRAEQEQQAGAPAAQSPDAIRASVAAGKMNADQELAQMRFDHEKEIAQIRKETEMIKMAANANISLDQIEAQLAKIRSDERLAAAEFGIKARMGTGI